MTARPYKVICISLYVEDLAELDAKVLEIRRRGLRGMTRSQLIRLALRAVDPEQVPVPSSELDR